LKICFPEYNGDDTFRSCTAYIREQFLQRNQNKKINIFTHITCATDSQNVKKVFADVQHTIVNESLRKGNLI